VSATLKRLAVPAASVLIAAALVEVALRLWIAHLPVAFLIYLSPRLRDSSPAVTSRLHEALPALGSRKEDPDTGWTFPPNRDWTGKNEDGEPYSARTSPEGFFTPDLPGKSERQLILLGDSFLSTFYVRRPIQNVIRDALGTPTYDLAVGGWGPESYLAAYRKFAGDRRHDLVVVFSFNNDISDVENWQRWKHEDRSESFLMWIQRTVSHDLVNLSASWPDTHLVLWNLARFSLNRPGRAAAPAPGGASSGRGPTRERYRGFELQFLPGLSFLVHDSDAFLPGGEYYDSIAAYLDSLRRLRAAIEANHARMVLVWIPSQERVYLPLLPPERQARYVTNTTHDIAGLERVLHRFADSEGLSFFDLAEPLTERARAGEKLYFTVDAHLNSHGNEVAGDLVAQYLRQLPANPPPTTADRVRLLTPEELAIERPLLPSAMQSPAEIVHADGNSWTARGKAAGQYSYLGRWPEAALDGPQRLIVTGVLRRGGLTVGLLKNDQWALTRNVTTPGPFELAIPFTGHGTYVPIVASCLPASSLDTDFDITSLGWAAKR
jgi:hypothetical protein